MINIEYSIFIVVNYKFSYLYTLHMKARYDVIWSQINICSSFPNLFIIKSDTINAIPSFNVEKNATNDNLSVNSKAEIAMLVNIGLGQSSTNLD